MQNKQSVKTVKLELTFEEVNIVIESLGKQPFIEVYKIIEKIHLQAKNNSSDLSTKE